jgi:cardiolipin synthase C
MVYLFGTDEAGSLTLHMMMKKALEGVRVRLLLDWYTEAGKPDINDEIVAAIQRELQKQAGPAGLKGSFEIRYYNRGTLLGSLGRVNHRNHAKVLITDNKEILVGGRNVGDDYFSMEQDSFDYIDRELWVRGKSKNPAQNSALQAAAAFDAYWNDEVWVSKPKALKKDQTISDEAQDAASLGEEGSVPEQDLRDEIQATAQSSRLKTYLVNRVTLAIDKPAHKKSDRVVTPTLNTMIGATDRYLMMENYSLPMSDAKLRLMKSVAARKVPILILTNGFAAHDSVDVSAYSQPQEAALLKSAPNVWLWAFRGKALPGDLRLEGWRISERVSTHAKTVVSLSGNRWFSAVGSYNFDVRSEKTNNEAMLIVEDAAVAADIIQDISQRMNSAHSVVVGEKNRLYYSDTQEYQPKKQGDFKKIMGTLGFGKLLRSLY